MEENMIVIRFTKSSYFDFEQSKDIDKNIKHELNLSWKAMNL